MGNLSILSRQDRANLRRAVGVRRKSEMTSRILGATPGKFTLADKTAYQTVRLGGAISRLRIGIPCDQDISVPFKVSVAVGEDVNNGYQIRNAAGAVLTPTVVTQGTRDITDWEAARVPSGIYQVIFTAATKFIVFDPAGTIVGGGTVGVAFTSTKVNFTITAGGNAFAAGDGFVITANVAAATATSAAVAGNTGNGTMGAVTFGTNTATGVITNTQGTYNGQTLREGIAWFDALAVNHGQAVDGGAGVFVHVRAWSSDFVPGSTGNMVEGSSAIGVRWIGNGEPGYQQGYWYGDQTTNPNPVASVTDNSYGLSAQIRAVYDVPGQNHVAGGDSTMKGYTGNTPLDAGGIPGNIMGFPRLVRNAIRARGVQCELTNLAETGEQSTMFLRRLLREILTGKYTHAWIQCASVNDLLGPGSPTPKPSQVTIAISLDLVRQCLQACYATDTFPIVVESCAIFGPQNSAWYAPQQAFLDNLEASGVAVHRAPDLLYTPDRSAWRPEYFLDGSHANYAGQKAQAADIIVQPDYYQLN